MNFKRQSITPIIVLVVVVGGTSSQSGELGPVMIRVYTLSENHNLLILVIVVILSVMSRGWGSAQSRNCQVVCIGSANAQDVDRLHPSFSLAGSSVSGISPSLPILHICLNTTGFLLKLLWKRRKVFLWFVGIALRLFGRRLADWLVRVFHEVIE